MARDVRRGCLVSGFHFHYGIRSHFSVAARWGHLKGLPSLLAFSPHNVSMLTIFAVGTPFRTRMLAIAPAFQTINNVTGMNLNYKKKSWVQCGIETCGKLHRWFVGKCLEFEALKITRVAQYVGATIGRDGCLHRLAAPRNQFDKVYRRIKETTKNLVERLVEFEACALSVLSFGSSTGALHGRT